MEHTTWAVLESGLPLLDLGEGIVRIETQGRNRLEPRESGHQAVDSLGWEGEGAG